MKHNSFIHDLIIDRDFLNKEKLTLIYRPERKYRYSGEKVQLLPQFDICEVTDSLKAKIDNCHIDFDKATKRRLKQLIVDIKNSNVRLMDDNYVVRINLKDASIHIHLVVLLLRKGRRFGK